MKETLLGGSWKGLITLEMCFEGTDCRVSACLGSCSFLAPTLRGCSKTRARCQCFCLPSLPRWQAGMTRSRLDVVGGPALLQQAQDGFRTPSLLPGPACRIGEPPAREPSSLTREGFDSIRVFISSEIQHPYPHLLMDLPTALPRSWHGREVPEHRAPNQTGSHCPLSASRMNILLDLLLPQPLPSHPPLSSPCQRVLHLALSSMIHGG